MRTLAFSLALCTLALGCQDAPDDAAVADRPAPLVTEPVQPPEAADPETLGGDLPSYAARLLSGPYVEASYFALPPGASVAMQNGENWVVYAYSDASVTVDDAPTEWAAGSAAFYDAPTRITNAGDADAQLLFFERWANPLPDRREDPDEDIRFPYELTQIDRIDSPAVDVLVSNDDVGVALVTLAPGESLPPHSAFSRVVVALSEFEEERSQGDEFGGDSPDVRVQGEAGSVSWETARNYAVENVGATPSETLVVAYYE
ncbi:hypothetical protein [Rubrivirga litoralis]|uniref:Uncharacterized protein n=1 Tax=Rubrivirga litoralis TaxID=3075598 RepID=A0ABU3BV87_9BACT|nr:hypothetical protein [Rubrivirga sp. F394]MDT0633066.1 hypothetical protein [Rubrivirga sp. F394]